MIRRPMTEVRSVIALFRWAVGRQGELLRLIDRPVQVAKEVVCMVRRDGVQSCCQILAQLRMESFGGRPLLAGVWEEQQQYA